jgi:hypothetical protein
MKIKWFYYSFSLSLYSRIKNPPYSEGGIPSREENQVFGYPSVGQKPNKCATMNR